MFLSHYAAGLAAKKWAPKISLGILFLAAVGLDLLWSFFLIFGWESVRIIPGITKVIPCLLYTSSDYLESLNYLKPYADYFAINVSCLLYTSFLFLPSVIRKNGKVIDPFETAANAFNEKKSLSRFLSGLQ